MDLKIDFKINQTEVILHIFLSNLIESNLIISKI